MRCRLILDWNRKEGPYIDRYTPVRWITPTRLNSCLPIVVLYPCELCFHQRSKKIQTNKQLLHVTPIRKIQTEVNGKVESSYLQKVPVITCSIFSGATMDLAWQIQFSVCSEEHASHLWANECPITHARIGWHIPMFINSFYTSSMKHLKIDFVNNNNTVTPKNSRFTESYD